MKKIFTFTALLLIAATLLGQAPASFKYQAVLRDSRGNVKANVTANIKIDILQGSSSGNIVYSENHSVTTNMYGLINLEVGNGAATKGSFSVIDWGTSTYFIKIFVDGVEMGTDQLLSVPYALNAKTAEKVTGKLTEFDPVFLASPAMGITSGNLTNWTTAFGWGNHATAGYLKATSPNDQANWNTAFGWGNHATAGYLKTYTETDPSFLASPAGGITATNITGWNTAVGWGDHAAAGYLKSNSENDPIFKAWDKSTGIVITAAQVSDFDANVSNNAAVIQNTAKLSYPAVDKLKLAGIQDSAEINVNADWNATSGDAKILNKPTIPVGTNVGDIQYWNGTAWIQISVGTTGQVLTINGSNIPSWQNASSVFLLPPTATSLASTNVQSFSATLNGVVNAKGLSTTVVFEWGQTTAYGNTLNASQSLVTGNLDVAVSANLTGLQSATNYHYRIKATNPVNVTNSSDMTFTTELSVPILTTTSASSILAFSVTTGGNITHDGGSPVTTSGVCYSTSSNPTTANNTVISEIGSGSFVSNLTGLTNATTYYVRAYATNSIGTSYGDEISFKTSSVLPTITTTAISDTTQTTATSGGNVTNDGGASVTARGVCWSTSANPTTANSKTTNATGTGTFTSSLSGLTGNTTYYVRSYSTNSAGTSYGNEVSFKTSPNLPTVTTTTISAISQTTATSGGNITDDGGASISARGVCWSTSSNPTTADAKTTDATGTGVFTSSLTSLTASTLYYVRSYSTNSAGTSYGNEVSFKTFLGIVTDIDGNVYNTVTIGTQEWMVENLKTTKYNDGTGIPNVTDNTQWVNLTTPGYCWYNNDAANKNPYGALYNWQTVNTGKLAPTGWHVPTDAEWTTLTTYLGGDGGKLKEAGTIHWPDPNDGATNESGFTALPAGIRENGTFYNVGYHGYWWSSTEYWNLVVGYANNNVFGSTGGTNWGLSVRCVKGEITASIVIPTIGGTTAASSISTTSATSGGNISSDGGAFVSERGVCWSTNQNPSIADNKTADGTGIGSFTSSITGLTENTIYYIRAYATNSVGTAYGNEVSFRTLGTVTDIDGNVYNTVTIGTQEWMVENLKTTKYNDGTGIPNVTDGSEWANLTTPGFCLYNNDIANKNPYGALYNWYTVNTGNLAPTGWHVPSDAEWTTLTTYLGGESGAGGKLKEAGTIHWADPNYGATNERGFTALPAGFRDGGGPFLNIGYRGFWWSSAETSTASAWNRFVVYDYSSVNRGFYTKQYGFSVRCLRD